MKEKAKSHLRWRLRHKCFFSCAVPRRIAVEGCVAFSRRLYKIAVVFKPSHFPSLPKKLIEYKYNTLIYSGSINNIYCREVNCEEAMSATVIEFQTGIVAVETKKEVTRSNKAHL